MSLIGALNTGASGLTVSQAAMQVTGNNIANVDNPNYAREVATTTEGSDQEIQPGLYVGSGIDLTSIQRQVDQALNDRVNSASSDNSSASALANWTGQVQSVFDALGSNSMSASLSTFLSDWSNLANNPQDASQRQVVIQDGQALAQQYNTVSTQLGDLSTELSSQIGTDVTNANQLAQQIASLNQQISTSQSQVVGGNNSLEDQRDAAVQSLSKLVNVQTVQQGNGTVNVYIGSQPLVLGTQNMGLAVQASATSTGMPSDQIVFASDNGNASITSGELGGLMQSQTQLNSVQDQVNSLASGLIYGLNSVYSSGQGTIGYSTVTATNAVASTTAALNSSAAGLSFPPTNGSFVITVANSATGLSSSTLVPVTLTGSSSDTTLSSLAASINAIPSVQATISGGKLTISSTSPNDTITFSQDSSGVLAGLGINTFFTGDNAQNIGVNSQVAGNPNLLAAAMNGQPDDNQTALAIANLATTNQSVLGGSSINNAYSSMINGVAISASQANSDVTSTGDVLNTLQAQQQSISGVSMDEETINLIKQQTAYGGAAKFISTIDSLMQSLLQMTT